MGTVALTLLAFAYSVFLANGLKCKCNKGWQDIIDMVNKADALQEVKDTIGFLTCESEQCEVKPDMCKEGTSCYKASGATDTTPVVPICARYLTPLGSIAEGCGWELMDESVSFDKDGYHCLRLPCEAYKNIGFSPEDCSTNDWRHILFSYVCTTDMCNSEKAFDQVCRGVE